METKNQDWTGNSKASYSILGASNHSEQEREMNDYYATEPRAVELLLELEDFRDNIWECACGEGHISNVLQQHGYTVANSNMIDRGLKGTNVIDFLQTKKRWSGDIITNPPYKFATEFVEQALYLVDDGCKVAMFLKIQFLETKSRKVLFDKYPPKTVYVSSSRLACAMNGAFDGVSRAVCYCWYVWEKGYQGDTVIKWFN